MAHRKGEKEALRRAREEREAKARSEQQRKRLVGYGSAAVIAIVAVVLIVMLAGGGGDDGTAGAGDFFPSGGDVSEQQEFDVEAAARAAGCELESSKSEGRRHTTDPGQTIDYKSNPPVTGRHYEIPADDGVYGGTPPRDEALVHSLEHGRVVVWVKPSVPADARASIRSMSDADEGYQTLLVQRRNMPYDVAASAWNRDPTPNGTGQMLSCESWSPEVIDALRAFRDEHRSNGPEPVP